MQIRLSRSETLLGGFMDPHGGSGVHQSREHTLAPLSFEQQRRLVQLSAKDVDLQPRWLEVPLLRKRFQNCANANSFQHKL